MRIRTFLSWGLVSIVGSLFTAAQAAPLNAPLSTPMLSKIACSGKTREPSGDRAAKITFHVETGSTTYPAQVTARLELGSDSPETLLTTLTNSVNEDEAGRLVHVFHSALDLHRSFEAQTADLRTGVGALKLEGPMRAPSLRCTFTVVGENSGEGGKSGLRPSRPASGR